jgi:hypothetical protein
MNQKQLDNFQDKYKKIFNNTISKIQKETEVRINKCYQKMIIDKTSKSKIRYSNCITRAKIQGLKEGIRFLRNSSKQCKNNKKCIEMTKMLMKELIIKLEKEMKQKLLKKIL